jgi:anhydro-N-acetylmuramic acid kinase
MISGTSRDGVDSVLVRFGKDEAEVIAASCLPYPAELSAALTAMVQAGRRPESNECEVLDPPVAEHFSRAALTLMEDAKVTSPEIAAIGSHGQTVWHDPDGPEPESIQLGSPQRIATATGIPTVGNFRQADLAAGGQGAPLAPLLHRALLRPDRGRRIVLNLGGIANISVLDAGGGVRGYDTGPANCLLDAWVRSIKGLPFDRDGAWAAGGRVNATLLNALLADPYFHRPAPKSTGIEYFGLEWLNRALAGITIGDQAVQATLAELTAASVAGAIRTHRPDDVRVCGGGIHNQDLMARLQRRLPGVPVGSTAACGLDPDWVEAVLFAWLARERLDGRPQDTPPITGASRPALLGELARPA